VSDGESKTSEEANDAREAADEGAAHDGDGADVAEPSPLEQLQAERDRLKDQLLRTAADFDNFRKRSRKELEQAERRGREEILRELLPVFDNLERAIDAAKGASDLEAIQQGVEMVLKLFEDTASRIGLARVDSVGQRFDPNLHDAFQQQPTDEVPPGTIVAEYQAGYRLGDRLVRPAMVVVAKKPENG
jgi:molecular chaperone GrpE